MIRKSPSLSVLTASMLIGVAIAAQTASAAKRAPFRLELRAQSARMRTMTYELHSTPIDVGPRLASLSGGCCSCVTNDTGFAWSCDEGCYCAGAEHAFSLVATWEGYSRPFTWAGRCPCYYADQPAIDEIEDRGVSLALLDASGNPLEWQNPVLVGESVVVETTVGGDDMTAADFADLFGGRIRLKAFYVDAQGEHQIANEPIPVAAANVTAPGGNVFRIPVSASWLQSNGIARNDDDGIAAKTSIDMSDAAAGSSNRQDSDYFDEHVSGRLYGRARGTNGTGAESAAIPEGTLNLKTVQAGGTACLVATVGASRSAKKQCQQQSDILYYSGHGGHDTGKLYGVAGPSDVTNFWHDIDIAVFAGCSVLDIGDRAGNYENPASHGASPGLRWLSASGASVLLGYAYKAPTDEQGGTAIVAAWVSCRSGFDDAAAWMKANDNSAGRNACAIRRIGENRIEYRYFMKAGRRWNLRNKYSEIVEVIDL